MRPGSARETHPSGVALALGYLGFIIYGSLIPFNLQRRSLVDTWQVFLDTPFLVLGVESRADWVANGLLYVPLGYLFASVCLAKITSAPKRLLGASTLLGACAVVALAVEFTQLFFPPRTVSLNDILAEIVGSTAGIAAWMRWGALANRMRAAIQGGGMVAIKACAILYAIAYLALSLFPFDFVVSAAELSEKLAAGGYGLIIAPGNCTGVTACTAKLIAEMASVVPVGILLGMVQGRNARRPYGWAAGWGLMLGIAIEVAQLLVLSGASQGLSVATRVMGLLVGVATYRTIGMRQFRAAQPYLAVLVTLGGIPYLLVLAWFNGWFSTPWSGIGYAHTSLEDVHWMPFYYHYFTTETSALRSLLACAAMYVPIGISYLGVMLGGQRRHQDGNALIPALVAAPLAFVIEMGKLFLPGKHPDPTNILIAATAASCAYLVALQLYSWSIQAQPNATMTTNRAAPPVEAATEGPGLLQGLLAFALLAGTAAAVFYYPLGAALPGTLLCAYAALLWRYPWIALPVALGLLPLLNFAPWTGWVLIDEFDMLVCVSIAVLLLRKTGMHGRTLHAQEFAWPIWLLALSFLSSAWIGFFPAGPLDWNAIAGYYSGFNGLRVLKGFVWPLALLMALRAENRSMETVWPVVSIGMILGLCVVIAVSVWQRMVFTSLLDFASEYRIEGPFPELHVGGGDLHGYLVMAISFAAAIALCSTPIRAAAATAILVLSAYVVAVTFTRGAYIGFAGALILLTGAIARHRIRRGDSVARAATAALPLVVGLAVIVPILGGAFMQTRIASFKADGESRFKHWVGAVNMMDSSALTSMLGMGAGSFPRNFLLQDPASAPATLSFLIQDANGFVRLGSGRPMYLGQRVSTRTHESYTVSFDVRGQQAGSKLDVQLCERSEQISFQCESTSVDVPVNPDLALCDESQQGLIQCKSDAPAGGAAWHHIEARIDSKNIGVGSWILRRPVVLALHNPEKGRSVDVDNIRLMDSSGQNLVSNGDFEQAGARWFFSTDDHLPWHIFNLWVQVYFEQGLLGLIAFCTATLIALCRLTRSSWRGDLFSGAALAALGGFLVVGLFESLFDGPRITTVFFLLLFLALQSTPPASHSPAVATAPSRRKRHLRRDSSTPRRET